MSYNSDPFPRRKASLELDWDRYLSAAIQALPSVQNLIAERAYQFYLKAGLPGDAALDHWLAAESEARSWIQNAINCTHREPNETVSLRAAQGILITEVAREG